MYVRFFNMKRKRGNYEPQNDPNTSPQLFARYHGSLNSYAECGFGVMRISVALDRADAEGTLDAEYLASIKKAVDCILKTNMRVILDLRLEHNDYKSPFPSGETFAHVWTQLSKTFRDYDERLMFESLHEEGSQGKRCTHRLSEDTGYEILNALNQIFVDTVRNSRGNNEMRLAYARSSEISPIPFSIVIRRQSRIPS